MHQLRIRTLVWMVLSLASPAIASIPLRGDGVVEVAESGVFYTLTITPTATPTPTPGVSVDVGVVSGKPGEQVRVDVTLHTAGFDVAGVQNDISFYPSVVSLSGCAANPGIDKTLTAFKFSGAGLRAIVLGNNVTPIPDGSVLYTCTFSIAPDAAPGRYLLYTWNVGAASTTGREIHATGSPGAIVILDSRPTRIPTPTPTPARPSIVLETAIGYPGDQVIFPARLSTVGVAVAGTQNDITFDGVNAPIAADPAGRPDCVVNPDIDKSATSFAFLPIGCSGTACAGVRALVLASDNIAPISNGSALYTCRVSIAPSAAPGEYPLTISNVVMSDPFGRRVADAAGGDGTVVVLQFEPTPTPVGPAILVSTVAGNAGDQLSITATLQTAGAVVAGTQNDITFDSANAPIAATAAGKPDCTVNPDINKEASSFAFRPNRCSAEACTTVRALILSISSPDPIPDGAVLYTCRVNVAATAPTGAYPLTVSGVVLSDPAGRPVAGAIGGSGLVLMGDVHIGHDPHGEHIPPPILAPPAPLATASPAASAAPSFSPRGMPTATPSATAVAGTGLAEGDPGQSAFIDDGGCAIGAQRAGHATPVLLLSAVGVMLMRRRRRTSRRD